MDDWVAVLYRACLIFNRENAQAAAGPSITNDVGGIVSAGIDVDGEGYQRLSDVGTSGNGADYNDGEFMHKGVIVGICNIKLIRSGNRLFVGGDSLKVHIAEYRFPSSQEQIERGTTISHIGKAVTTGSGG